MNDEFLYLSTFKSWATRRLEHVFFSFPFFRQQRDVDLCKTGSWRFSGQHIKRVGVLSRTGTRILSFYYLIVQSLMSDSFRKKETISLINTNCCQSSKYWSGQDFSCFQRIDKTFKRHYLYFCYSTRFIQVAQVEWIPSKRSVDIYLLPKNMRITR